MIRTFIASDLSCIAAAINGVILRVSPSHCGQSPRAVCCDLQCTARLSVCVRHGGQRPNSCAVCSGIRARGEALPSKLAHPRGPSQMTSTLLLISACGQSDSFVPMRRKPGAWALLTPMRKAVKKTDAAP